MMLISGYWREATRQRNTAQGKGKEIPKALGKQTRIEAFFMNLTWQIASLNSGVWSTLLCLLVWIEDYEQITIFEDYEQKDYIWTRTDDAYIVGEMYIM